MVKAITLALIVFGLSQTTMAQDFGMDRTWDRGRERDFVKETALSGMMEVELGKLAEQKAKSEAVRAFGKMMQQDHSEANRKLEAVAQKVQMTLPTALLPRQRDELRDLQSLTGEEFDKVYMSKMVEAHETNIENFEEAQRRLDDEEIEKWVDNTLPLLKRHLQKAEEVESGL